MRTPSRTAVVPSTIVYFRSGPAIQRGYAINLDVTVQDGTEDDEYLAALEDDLGQALA